MTENNLTVTAGNGVKNSMHTFSDQDTRHLQNKNGAAIAPYDFSVPPLIRFGAGRVADIGEVVGLHGRRAWIVGGGRSFLRAAVRDTIEASLRAAGISIEIVAESSGEPTVDQVAASLAGLPWQDRDGAVVLAIGGGSTIDLAKALAVLATNMPAGREFPLPASDYEATVVDHLEGVGRGCFFEHASLPVVAVPTTAGTGAEATRNAVISCPRRGFKKSMRSLYLVPRAAIIDPDLTASCDHSTTAAAGLDCITQLIESFICRSSKPLPRALVLESLPGAVRALPRLLGNLVTKNKLVTQNNLAVGVRDGEAVADQSDGYATDRAALSHAALLSGMALANSGLGMAHGVAAALGVECGTPHGVACALMLPLALRVNSAVACADLATLERAIDPAASTHDTAAAAAFVSRIESICCESGLPQTLSQVGLRRDRIEWLADHSGGRSMQGNPIDIQPRDLQRMLTEIF